jgi:hypothetical protein
MLARPESQDATVLTLCLVVGGALVLGFELAANLVQQLIQTRCAGRTGSRRAWGTARGGGRVSVVHDCCSEGAVDAEMEVRVNDGRFVMVLCRQS